MTSGARRPRRRHADVAEAKQASPAAIMAEEQRKASRLGCQCQHFLNPLPAANGTSHVALQHYCRVCNIQLNSCRQARIHAEGKKHAKRFTYLKMCIEAGSKTEPPQGVDLNNNSGYFGQYVEPQPESTVAMPMLMMEPMDPGMVASTSYPVFVAAPNPVASPNYNVSLPPVFYGASQPSAAFAPTLPTSLPNGMLPSCSVASCPSLECFVPPQLPPPPPATQPSLLGPPPALLADYSSPVVFKAGHVEPTVMSPSMTTSGVSSDCCPETSSILSAASYTSSSPGFFPLAAQTALLPTPLASYPIKSKATAAKSGHRGRLLAAKAASRASAAKSRAAKEAEALRCDTCELRVNSTRQLQAHLAGQKHRARSLRLLQEGDVAKTGKESDTMCNSLLTSKSVSSGAFLSTAATSSECSSSSSSSSRRRRAMTMADSKSRGNSMLSRHCRSTSSLQKRSRALSNCLSELNKSSSMIISANRDEIELEDEDDDKLAVDWSNGDSAVEAGSTAANSCNSEEDEDENATTNKLVELVEAMKPVGLVSGSEAAAASSEMKSIPMLNVFFQHLSKKGATQTMVKLVSEQSAVRARRRSAGPPQRPPP